MSAQGAGGIIGGLLALYFLFDFFFWNGGLVDPAILSRIASVGVVSPI